jgi:hypothetical protein
VFLIAPLLMTVTLAANTNAATTGYTGTNPVQVEACSTSPQVNYYDDGNGLLLPETAGEQLKVKFTNTTNKQISSVTFAVRDGSGQPTYVTDTGRFAPGVTIAHSLQSPIEGDQLGCSISSVAFTDGSTWMPNAGSIANK